MAAPLTTDMYTMRQYFKAKIEQWLHRLLLWLLKRHWDKRALLGAAWRIRHVSPPAAEKQGVTYHVVAERLNGAGARKCRIMAAHPLPLDTLEKRLQSLVDSLK